eukprot:Partr_v1_DN28759_c0_g1_i8_m63298
MRNLLVKAIREHKGDLVGHVIGTQMKKTVKVRVAHEIFMPKYQKSIVRHKNYMAHDESMQCLVGDQVRIVPTTRLSKLKEHAVAEKVKAADVYIDPQTKYVYTNGHLRIPVGYQCEETGKIVNLVPQSKYKEMGLI